MSNADAKFITRLFNEILDTDATVFRIPRKQVAEGEDTPPVRYGVVLDQSGQMFGSVLSAKQFINEG